MIEKNMASIIEGPKQATRAVCRSNKENLAKGF